MAPSCLLIVSEMGLVPATTQLVVVITPPAQVVLTDPLGRLAEDTWPERERSALLFLPGLLLSSSGAFFIYSATI